MNRNPALRIRPCLLLQLTLRLSLCLALAMIGAYGSLACEMRTGLVRMVICSHGSAETIWLDVAGKPSSPVKTTGCESCPDCLGTGVADLSPAAKAGPAPDASRANTPVTAAAALVPDRPEIPLSARGPPVAAQV